MPKMNSEIVKIPALILAAGNSSRLGEPKQLLEINGKPLLSLIIDEVLGTGMFELSIILGAYSEEIEAKINKSGINIIYNPDWVHGIGSSIKAGLKSVIEMNPEGILILSSDQPLINSTHLSRLHWHFSNSDYGIIASGYSGTYGIPAMFRKDYFEKILEIGDNSGCRGIIRENINDACILDCPEGEFDIDTLDDFRRISRMF